MLNKVLLLVPCLGEVKVIKIIHRSFFAILIVAVFCHPRAVPGGDGVAATSKNIILITIDTLRADHLGCYGYYRNTTPAIDEFSKEAILFKTVVAPVPSTNPSHTSILTGLYPQNHGVIDNKPREIFSGVELLPILLRKKEMLTAAFVSGWTLKRNVCTLNKYFDLYDDHFKDVDRKASEVNKLVIDWLHKNAEKRFFLWIHYFDPHGNYLPPLEYVNRFYPVKEGELLRYYDADVSQRERIISSEKAKSQLVAQYDGEIAFVDDCLNKILRELKDLGLYDESLIIITSDHGESLTEHDYYFDHSLCLYDNSLKVPLLIKTPSSSPSRGIVKRQVGLIDIMPTILSFFKIPYDKGKFDGRDLTPLLEGEKELGKQAYYAKTFVNDPASNMACIRTEKYKYIYTYPWWADFKRINAQEELYNLRKDPKESENIASRYTKVSHRLKKKLFHWEGSFPTDLKSVESPEMSQGDLEKLRSLGYIR